MTLADLFRCGRWIVALDVCTCSFNLCEYYCDFGKLRINTVILHGTNRQRCWFSSVWQHIHFIPKITLHWCVLAVRSLSSVKQCFSWLLDFPDIKEQCFSTKTPCAFLMHLFALMRGCNCNSCSLYWMFDCN